jgi:glycosyltransferase involved in cell wall biosynthesis
MATVSVVMSVFNGERHLRESIESILRQSFEDFEFLIINDGSTDGSRDILAEYQRQDRRIRLIDQENRGLTLSLIRGCAEARGRYIARQDAGDVSLPQRLAKQVSYLEDHAEISLLSCWTRFLGPEDEELYCVVRRETPEEATSRLRCLDARRLQGVTHHGSTMFRRADYERVGGYRSQFRVAQDLDLWLRLTDSGRLAFLPEVLYLARFDADSISGHHHAAQVALIDVMLESMRARQKGADEEPLLRKAQAICQRTRRRSRHGVARGMYFIGRCLLERGDSRGMKYLRSAVRYNPFHLRAWAMIVLSRAGRFEST